CLRFSLPSFVFLWTSNVFMKAILKSVSYASATLHFSWPIMLLGECGGCVLPVGNASEILTGGPRKPATLFGLTVHKILYIQEERTMLVKELSSFRNQRDQLKAEVEKYRECDPQVVEEIRQANKVAKEAANRWTDNIFAIKSWAKRKFGFEESKIDKNFGIPEDFDYID
ncbi:hypothetical protein STEG23_027541, partial [Scotinomys teguina]